MERRGNTAGRGNATGRRVAPRCRNTAHFAQLRLRQRPAAGAAQLQQNSTNWKRRREGRNLSAPKAIVLDMLFISLGQNVNMSSFRQFP